MGQSTIDEDFATLATFTHPKLVELMGGREKYIKSLESMSANWKNRGYALRKFTVGEPSKPTYAFGDDYATVSCELELQGPRGKKGIQRTYMIAVSDDGGFNWKFVDGNEIGNDLGRLRSLFPNFPESIVLKATQKPEWEN